MDKLKLKAEELAEMDFNNLQDNLLTLLQQRLSENDICPITYTHRLSLLLYELSPYVSDLIPNAGFGLDKNKRDEYREKMKGDIKQYLSWGNKNDQ